MNDRLSGDPSVFVEPVQIVLPGGEIIEADELPHPGWGTQPGKRYLLVRIDEGGNEVWRKSWIIPPTKAESPPG